MTPLPVVSNYDVMICSVPTLSTLQLRRTVLRPRLSCVQCINVGDSDRETRHYGAFRYTNLIGVASVYRQPPPQRPDVMAWRLRGMAVTKVARHQGIEEELLHECVKYTRSKKGNLFWCYARKSAIRFYKRNGFSPSGEIFDFPGVGPVVLMIYDISLVKKKHGTAENITFGTAPVCSSNEKIPLD